MQSCNNTEEHRLHRQSELQNTRYYGRTSIPCPIYICMTFVVLIHNARFKELINKSGIIN